jgi:proline iminopeptidase
MNRRLQVRGTQLYVEDYNDSNEKVLLYLHGGPGASCVDFCYHQAEALASHVRVVAFDQRGVLRSDPLAADEPFQLQDIIEDCEALRIQLGIKKWTVLGHSFGGLVALRYALQYPHSVHKVIFESPCFDAQSSMRALISGALKLYHSLEDSVGVKQCKQYLEGPYSASELWSAWSSIGKGLGDKRDELYFHGIRPDTYNEIIHNMISDESMWDKNHRHAAKLEEEGNFLQSLIPDLSKLTQPSLLITGAFDFVCCAEQQQAYRDRVKNGKVAVFEGSGHFPRLEEPDKYTYEVLKFITDKDDVNNDRI